MNEVNSNVCAEESWRGVMLKLSSIDGSVMVATKANKFSLILLEKLGILMVQRIPTMKNFDVSIARSLDTPKRSIGNSMENLRINIGMGKIKHGNNTVKQIWQIVKEALKKNRVSTVKNLERETRKR